MITQGLRAVTRSFLLVIPLETMLGTLETLGTIEGSQQLPNVAKARCAIGFSGLSGAVHRDVPYENQTITLKSFDLEAVKRRAVKSYDQATQFHFLKEGPLSAGVSALHTSCEMAAAEMSTMF